MRKAFHGLVRGRLIKKRLILLTSLVACFLVCYGIFTKESTNANSVASANLTDGLGVTKTYSRWATEGDATTSDTGFVTLGSFPQSVVDSNPGVASPSDGQVYTVGSDRYLYESDIYGSNAQWYKFEPIKWQILDVDSANNRLLLMSQSVLESRAWDTQASEDIKWAGSGGKYPAIRLYLNNYRITAGQGYSYYPEAPQSTTSSDLSFYGNDLNSRFYDQGFLQKAFTGYEYSDAIINDSWGGDGPADKVRLISEANAINTTYGFDSAGNIWGPTSNRYGYYTGYSAANNFAYYSYSWSHTLDNNRKTQWWWTSTQTSGHRASNAVVVDNVGRINGGTIGEEGEVICFYGIRPVITIDLSKLANIDGTGSLSSPYNLVYIQTTTFNADGGTVTQTSIKTPYGSAIGTLPTPTKTGYVFTGWERQKSDGSGWEALTATSIITDDNTYFAKWTPGNYKVTLDNKGATSAGTASYYEKYSAGNYTDETSQTAISSITVPSKTGYTFGGYYTGDAGTGTQYISDAGVISSTSTTFTDNVTLYAKWTPITYNITYTLNDGTLADNNPETYTVETETFTLNNPAKTGYTFKGWTGTNGETPETSVSITKGSTGDKTFTANWELITYNITYTLNDGTVETANPETYDVEIETFTLNNPTKTGYTFKGWTGSNGETPETVVTISKGSTGDRTYEANWELTTYNITYILNDGTPTDNNPETYTVETETFTLNNPTKTGYTFKGWTGEGVTTPSKNLQITKGSTGDKTFTANWELITYNITYTLNDGTLTDSNLETYTVETETFTLNNPAKTGYTFKGWTGTNGDTPETSVSITKGTIGDKTFVANFEVTDYQITYNLSDGTTTNPGTYTVETETITLSDATKTGYTFKGWTGEGVTTPSKNLQITKGSTGDKTFTANFEMDTYTISYTLNGGTSTNPETYTVETETFTLNNPTKTGYTFKGWTGEGVTTPSKNLQITKGSTGNRTYEAIFEANTNTPYVVNHYKMNDDKTTYTKEVADTENKTGTSDETVQISTLAKTYDGLYLEGGFLGTVTDDKKPASFVTSTKILPDGSLVINIYYTRINPNPPSGGGGGGGSKPSSSSVTPTVNTNTGNSAEDKEVSRKLNDEIKKVITGDNTIKELPKPIERDGYKYEGLYYDEACTRPVKPGDKITNETQFFIKWEEIPKPVDDNTKNKIVKNGVVTSLPEPSKKDGYNFDGYYYDEECTKPVKLGDKVDENTQIFVKWEELPKTIDEETKKELISNGKITSLDSPEDRPGYFFDGYYYDKECTKPVKLGDKVNDKTEIFVKWVDTNKQIQNELSKVLSEDNVVTKLPREIEREGYIFEGYFYDEECTKPVKAGDKIPEGTQIFVKWEEVSKLVQKEISKVISENGTLKELPKPIERDGYSFEGYYYDEECTKPLKVGDKITDDTKIFVKWKKLISIKEGFIHYIDGYEDGTFKPNNNITRAELAKIIASLSEEFDMDDLDTFIKADKEFNDVRTDYWNTPFIGFVIKNGIMNGYRWSKFKPEQYVTRAEVCKVLCEVFTIKEVTSENKYQKEIKGKWYEEPVSKLVKANLIKGYSNGTFGANNNITRAEVVTLINRLRGVTISDEELNKVTNKFNDIKKTNWYYRDVIIASMDK